MKRKIQILFVLLASIVFLAAAIELPPLLISREGATPDLESESSVEVGETMYTEFSELLHRSIVIDEKYQAQKYKFPVNSVLYGYEGAKGNTYWCSADVQIRQMGMDLKPFCFIDIGSDGTIDKRNTGGVINKSVKSPKYHEENLTASSDLHERLPRDIFRLEVVYQGVGSGSLRLLYREYKGDFVRPAFSQDLTFELEDEGPTLVAVKGSRIEVFEAGNLGIRYRVIKGFGG